MPSSSHPSPFSDSPEFLRLLRGEVEPDLPRLALEVAQDAYPSLDTHAQISRIEILADRTRDRCPEGAKARHILGQINWVLFVEEGFRGNTDDYQDPRNSYLNAVMDRKVGIPISLSILYLAIAERLGLTMAGVNLPGHFLVRAGRGDSTIFVDPFNQGAFLEREGCRKLAERATGRPIVLSEEILSPCSTHAIVLRILRNLKASYLRDSDFVQAVPVIRRLVALSKRDHEERRDLGIACARAGMPGEALRYLKDYLAARPNAPDTYDILALAAAARHEIAGTN